MPKKKRLSRAEIASLPKRITRRLSGEYFSLSVFETPGASGPKMTCVISKKVIKAAHDRNLVKRRCKEASRPFMEVLRAPVSLLFYGKRSAQNASYSDISKDIRGLFAGLK